MNELGFNRDVEEFNGRTVLMDQYEEFTRLINSYENGFEEELSYLAAQYNVSIEDFKNNILEQLEFLKLRMLDEDYLVDINKNNDTFIPNIEDALQNDWEQLEIFEDEDYYISATERARKEVERDYEGY